MSNRIVGVSDCQWSNVQDESIVTYALGSCIALSVYDARAMVGGMLHFMLPDAELNRDKAKQNPYTFADSGIPILFRRAYELGAVKSRLSVFAVGGAQVMADQEMFNIGRLNQLALRKLLWKAGVLLQGEAVGGAASRTVRLEMKTGRLLVKEAGGNEFELSGGWRGA